MTFEVRKLSATEAAGREREPAERVKPFSALSRPAEAIVPEPVVARLPEVKMEISPARSAPTIVPFKIKSLVIEPVGREREPATERVAPEAKTKEPKAKESEVSERRN